MATGRTAPGKKTGRSQGTKPAARRSTPAPPPARVLDDDSRHEIVGIVLGALAIALAISVFTQAAGVIPLAIKSILRVGFGLGAYAIPVIILLWAVTFFLTGLRVDEFRVGMGLGLVLVAFLGILAIGNDPACSGTAPRSSPPEVTSVAGWHGYFGHSSKALPRSVRSSHATPPPM